MWSPSSTIAVKQASKHLPMFETMSCYTTCWSSPRILGSRRVTSVPTLLANRAEACPMRSPAPRTAYGARYCSMPRQTADQRRRRSGGEGGCGITA
eukprot:1212866-Rhodomonas_salina.1